MLCARVNWSRLFCICIKMTHFIHSYPGNKRKELKQILEKINLDGIDEVIEPFCGTSAVSFELYKTNKDLKFYLNDIDKDLIRTYELLKTESVENITNKMNDIIAEITDKESHAKVYERWKNHDCIFDFLCIKKNSTKGRITFYGKSSKVFKFTKLQLEFIEFIKSPNVFVSCGDWSSVYRNEPNVLCFIDPPYMLSYNALYRNQNKLEVYEYFYENPPMKENCSLVFVLENNWVVKLLFKGCYVTTYPKTYVISRKETVHALITNF